LKIGVIKSLDDIDGIGHRVAHGGAYTESKLITEEVIDVIIKMSSFAPSHNPVNAVGIKAFQKALPKIGQVAVFDTSFHQTIEEEHFIYPIPYRYYKDYKIRKYGFHGTSHQYISETTAQLLKDDKQNKIISCHLGNGSSI